MADGENELLVPPLSAKVVVRKRGGRVRFWKRASPRGRAAHPTPRASGFDDAMADEETEPLQTGTFIFPTGGTGADTYEGEWKEREYADGEEVPRPPNPWTARTRPARTSATARARARWPASGATTASGIRT